jgi:hypothetical protein
VKEYIGFIRNELKLWIHVFDGYRMILLQIWVTHEITRAFLMLDGELQGGVFPYLAMFYSVVVLGYPASKAASGLRDRMRGFTFVRGEPVAPESLTSDMDTEPEPPRPVDIEEDEI